MQLPRLTLAHPCQVFKSSLLFEKSACPKKKTRRFLEDLPGCETYLRPALRAPTRRIFAFSLCLLSAQRAEHRCGSPRTCLGSAEASARSALLLGPDCLGVLAKGQGVCANISAVCGKSGSQTLARRCRDPEALQEHDKRRRNVGSL